MNTGPRTTKRLADLWGERVKARRTQVLQCSQDKLAELAGVTQQTISNLESGKGLPRDDVKVAIARACGTSPDELFPWPSMAELDEDAA